MTFNWPKVTSSQRNIIKNMSKIESDVLFVFMKHDKSCNNAFGQAVIQGNYDHMQKQEITTEILQSVFAFTGRTNL